MGSVFLRGNAWVGEYKDRGKVKRKALGGKKIITKTMAREMLKKIEQRVKLGQYDMLDAENPTLSEFTKDYLKYAKETVKKRSWRSDESCLKNLNSFFGSRQLSHITAKDVDDYKDVRLARVKAATVNRELAVLRHLFNLAERWNKYFGKNPVAQAKLIPVNNQMERILTDQEEDALIRASNTYLQAILICALNTGMRKSEILTLKWANVNLNNNTIILEHTNTKSKKTTKIPINSTLRKLLLEQKLKNTASDYVFLSSKGTPYKREDSLRQSFLGALRRSGIEGLRFHDLRHTAATRMVEAGASIVAVSKILGHSDIRTTMRYAHPDNSLKEAVELLSKNFLDPVTDISTDI